MRCEICNLAFTASTRISPKTYTIIQGHMANPKDQRNGHEFSYFSNPYDDFMKKHLSHYGYYTGRNSSYRSSSLLFNEFNRNHGYHLGSNGCSESEDIDDPISTKDSVAQKHRSQQRQLSTESDAKITRLKEPRQLFLINNTLLCTQQAARWPAELEVAVERVRHRADVPTCREPFYTSTGLERMPEVVGINGAGRKVFELQAKPGLFFLHSRVGGTRDELKEAATPLIEPDDSTLQFESRFESGNLEKAFQVGQNDYELWLRDDLYTNKHTQWFYFRVQNTRKDAAYRFTICNFSKSSSLYNMGMKPCVYSEKDAAMNNFGWRRMGTDIKYYKTNITYVSGKGEKPYYALTFTLRVSHDDDTLYIAHCYPYTYTDLQDYLQDIIEHPIKSKICKLKVLSRSLAGNLVYLLTITAPSDEEESDKLKKAVVITARVHPGETNGSWMMKGLLDYLLSDASDAKLLRETFVFKIVPMLNPDGVIVGNYRCSLAGRDLNRNYTSLLKDSYPTIISTKLMIKKLLAEREIILYCDLHGHSRKQNVFIYGCENRSDPKKRLHERIFPAMLSKNCPDMFAYDECNFKVQKNKEGTGRIVMWNMGITNSYTLEATFCGSSLGKMKFCHFNTADFEAMGYYFCDTLLDFCDPDKTKLCNILAELEETLKQQIISQLERMGRNSVSINGKQVNLRDIEGLNADELYSAGVDISDDDGGSDSSLSDGLPVNLEYMQKGARTSAKKKFTKKERDQLRKEKSMDNLKELSTSNVKEEVVPCKPQSVGMVRHQNCQHPKAASCARSHHKPSSGRRPTSSEQCSTLKKVEAKLRKAEIDLRDLTISGAGYAFPDEVDQQCYRGEQFQKKYLESLIKHELAKEELPSQTQATIRGYLRYSGTTKRCDGTATGVSEGAAEEGERSFTTQYLMKEFAGSDITDVGLSEEPRGDTSAYTSNEETSRRADHACEAEFQRSKRETVSDTNLPASVKEKDSSQYRDQKSRLLFERSNTFNSSLKKEASHLDSNKTTFSTSPLTGQTRVNLEKARHSTGHGSLEVRIPITYMTPKKVNGRSGCKLTIDSQADYKRSTIDLQSEPEQGAYQDQLSRQSYAHSRLSHAEGENLDSLFQNSEKSLKQIRTEIADLQITRNVMLELAERRRGGGGEELAERRRQLTESISLHSLLTGQKQATIAGDGSESIAFSPIAVFPDAKMEQESSSQSGAPRVSLYMSGYAPPSAPKVQRRVQIKRVPMSGLASRQY